MEDVIEFTYAKHTFYNNKWQVCVEQKGVIEMCRDADGKKAAVFLQSKLAPVPEGFRRTANYVFDMYGRSMQYSIVDVEMLKNDDDPESPLIVKG